MLAQACTYLHISTYAAHVELLTFHLDAASGITPTNKDIIKKHLWHNLNLFQWVFYISPNYYTMYIVY
jgi:hypothetical protein